MNASQAAKFLKVSRTHIYRLIERGELAPERNPAYLRAGPVRISVAQLEAIKNRQPKPSTP